eukprot:1529118-Pleurochrysis_carterae.AAC.2
MQSLRPPPSQGGTRHAPPPSRQPRAGRKCGTSARHALPTWQTHRKGEESVIETAVTVKSREVAYGRSFTYCGISLIQLATRDSKNTLRDPHRFGQGGSEAQSLHRKLYLAW